MTKAFRDLRARMSPEAQAAAAARAAARAAALADLPPRNGPVSGLGSACGPVRLRALCVVSPGGRAPGMARVYG